MALPVTLEFRWEMLFGLGAILLTWTLGFAAARMIAGRSGHTVVAHVDSAFYPVTAIIVLGWLVAVVWGGWQVAATHDEPQGAIEPQQERREAERGENSPAIAGPRVTGEGEAIQDEGSRKLQDFRKEFFKNRRD